MLKLDHGGFFKPDPWQESDFAATDNAWLRLGGYDAPDSPRRVWIERPRGHSKTSDLALQALWALYHGKRCLRGLAAAADQDQARLLLDACNRLVMANDWLGKTLTGKQAIEVQRDRIINHATGSVLNVISSDVGSSFGALVDWIVVDELTHHTDNKGEQLWGSLFSTAAKKRDCLLLVITNAGSLETWQGRLREAVRNDPAWCFRRLEGPQASWLTASQLDEQKRLLPGPVYARLWLNEWQSGSGSLFDRDDIAAITTLNGPCLERRDGWQLFAGLDLGITKDASCLVVCGFHKGFSREIPSERPVIHNSTIRVLADLGMVDTPARPVEYFRELGTGRLEVCYIELWKPSTGHRVDISAIESRIIALHKRLGFRLAIDQWQAELLSQRLRQAGVPVKAVAATPSILQEQASLIQDAIKERTLSMYPHEELATDIVRLKLEDRGHSYRLTSPRVGESAGGTRHGDSASALMLALYATRIWPATLLTNRQLVYNSN